MSRHPKAPSRVRKALSGLQARMTLSYALTTVAAVLLIEIIVGAAVLSFLTQSSVADTNLAGGARQAAWLYALAAAAQADPTALDPRTTFEPGQPYSIDESWDTSGGVNGVRYIGQGARDTSGAAYALLVSPDGRVLASNYPARYPAGEAVAQLVPSQAALVDSALGGVPASVVGKVGTASWTAAAAEPVWNKAHQPIGAVLVQEPQLTVSTILGGFGSLVIASGVVLLLFTLPVGAVFGLFTTRGLVRRIRRLASATARFAEGDDAQRVPVSSQDEVGQLEQHFNLMAEQLAESAAQRARLVDQQARREERARIEQELHTARSIQHSLLPKEVPGLSGWRFTPYYQPAREVGGDFYDFLPLGDGRWGIVVGDATGKGVPAALVMAIARTMLRTAVQVTASPAEALARVNELLVSDVTPGMFVTCFFAVLDPASGKLRFANAGHEPPLRHRPRFAAELLATGLPLGLFPGTRYDEGEASLASGESLLLYTDGLVEARDGAGEMFGFPRLERLLAGRECDDGLPDLVLGELSKHVGEGSEQEDDVTLLVLQRLGEASASVEVSDEASPAGTYSRALDGARAA